METNSFECVYAYFIREKRRYTQQRIHAEEKKQIVGIYDDFEIQIHMSIQWNARHGTEQSGKAYRTVNDANVCPHDRISSIVVQYS